MQNPSAIPPFLALSPQKITHSIPRRPVEKSLLASNRCPINVCEQVWTRAGKSRSCVLAARIQVLLRCHRQRVDPRHRRRADRPPPTTRWCSSPPCCFRSFSRTHSLLVSGCRPSTALEIRLPRSLTIRVGGRRGSDRICPCIAIRLVISMRNRSARRIDMKAACLRKCVPLTFAHNTRALVGMLRRMQNTEADHRWGC
jgi:hypothetical protein